MLFNMGVHSRRADNPQWLMEGLACQFEVPESRAARGLGRVNHTRLADLRDALGITLNAGQISAEELELAFASKRLVPFPEFLSDPQVFTRRDADIPYRYAQAWGLHWWLLTHHRDEYHALLRHYSTLEPLTEVSADQRLADFERIVGESPQELEREFQQEVKNLTNSLVAE